MTDDPALAGPVRRARRTLAVGGGLALAWVAFEIVWRLTGTPGKRVDYFAAMEQTAAAHQPPGENGWPYFVAAGRAADTADDLLHQQDLDAGRPIETVDLDWTRLSAPELDLATCRHELRWIDMLREQGVFDSLQRGADCPRIVRPMAGDGMLVAYHMPELTAFRQLAQARVGSMRVAVETGDDDELVAACEQSMALARATMSQPFMIDHLIGVAIANMLQWELRFTLVENRLGADTALALLAALDRQPLPPHEVCLQGERLMALDVIQWCFTDDGHGDGRLRMDRVDQMGMFTGGFGAGPAGAMQGLVSESRRETINELDAFYDEVSAMCRLTPIARMNMTPAALAAPTPSQFFLRMLLPAVGGAIGNRDDLDLHLAGLRIMLALEAAEDCRGAPPATLDELVPEFLDEVPTDPTHGGPFIYRRAGDDYILYSTGLDAIDGSASADETDLRGAKQQPIGQLNPIGFWSGLDVLINAPRGRGEG